MNCAQHPEQEAVDACRDCGKPICAGCVAPSRGRFTSPQHTPAPAAPAAAEPGRRRSPALAALLSFLPGLGQAYNGEYRKGIALLSLLVLLGRAAEASPRLGIFVSFLWFYQVFEAYYTAAHPERSRAGGGGSSGRTRLLSWLLIGGGMLLLAENLSGAILPQARYILPTLVITLGIALIASFFRGGQEARS
jgi:hypothetical protein